MKHSNGVNVIGHFTSSAGLGNSARLFSQLLERQGHHVACLDVDFKTATALADDERMVSHPEALPHDLNLFVVSLQVLPSLWLRRVRHLLSSRFRNVGLIFWELDRVPRPWRPSLDVFDSAVVCSRFVEDALRSASPALPVFYSEHPLNPVPATVTPSAVRDLYGIATNALAFISNFDPRSDIGRKNPLGALRAFRRAFPNEDDVSLVLKTNAGLEPAEAHPAVKELRAALEIDRRIQLVAKTMTHVDAMQLYGACDVNVSLHRSEGLGLGPLECMMQGKAVVATGYSGNMSFMTGRNSIPIPFELIPTAQASWQFMPEFAGRSARWAEPDLGAAAAALRWCREHPLERQKLGERGRLDALDYQVRAWKGEGLQCALDAAAAAVPRPFRKARVASILLQELADPTMRRLNLAAVGKSFRSRLTRPR